MYNAEHVLVTYIYQLHENPSYLREQEFGQSDGRTNRTHKHFFNFFGKY